MNKQRKVVITVTYNEMGIIIDTKAEKISQPNLQPTCNRLATDTISRQAAIAVADSSDYVGLSVEDVKKVTDEVVKGLKRLPPAQPDIIRCKDCKWFGEIGCAISVVDDTDKPTENDFCSFAERKTDE